MKDTKKIVRSLAIFILLIILTFWVIFKDQDIGQIINLITNVNLIYVLFGIIAMCFYFSAEAFNVRAILKAFGEKISMLKGIKFTLISFFFSSITPAATGGQPMEIYYMRKEKISTTYSITALLIQLCCFQIVTLSLGIISALTNFELLKKGLIYLFLLGVFINGLALVAMLIGLFSKKTAEKLIDILIKILKFFKYKKIEEKKEELEQGLEKYNAGSDFIRKNKSIFIRTLIIVLFQMIAYFSVPFFIYKSFGFSEYSLFEIITLQSLLFCTVSGIPLPGSVGISEGVFLGIYSKIFGTGMLSSAMLLTRGINFYLFVIIGSIVFITNLALLKKHKIKEK